MDDANIKWKVQNTACWYKEDDVTEIIITNIKNDVDKSPRRFVTRPKSLESIFVQIENNEELQHETINLCQSILK